MRTKLLLNEGWKFHLGDIPHKKVTGKYPTYMHSKAKNGLGAAMASFYDGDFEDVRIPHDYVVSGEFDPLFNDTQGALERKTAWYRRHFNLPCQIDGKRFILVFDGAGKNSTVWCNGSLAGQNQSLYNAFYMDITPYLLDNTTNTISVKIENDDIEGWWYEGAGIYRDVWLIITDEISVDMWGTYVKPTLVEDENWKVDVETTVWNNSMQNIDAQVVQSIIDSENNIITSVKTEISARYSENLINQQLEIKSPKLWDLETPNLYNLKTEIYTNGKKIDDYDTSFGFRTLKYDNEKGFFLNGRSVKQRGLCYHQDHSNLGIALSVTNHKHRIKMMKEMGVNAYRSAHNPTAPGFLDLCDQNGIMVMEENRWFNWSEKTKKELITTLKCARNHPSVVIWSMGNEEPLQNTETGKRLAEELTKLINLYDDTRPSTLALNAGYFTDYAPAVTQVLGANYNAPLYKEMHEKHPSKPIIASETSLAAGNRGIYFESENHDIMNRGGYVDDYDLKRGLVVGSSCKETIKCMEENDFVGGTYMWTGEEYRGEAQWPKLFASSGATDSCGFMKDKAYLIKSLWTTQPMVHVFPHWSLQGKQGDTIQVVAYNNACQVELFVNGESAGRKQNERFNPPQWFVEYQPGCIEAVAYDETGKIIATDKSVTAGEAKTLVIENELEGVTNTGEDFAFFTLYLLDKDGNYIPTSNNLIEASVIDDSQGEIVSVSGGDPLDHTNTKSHSQKMFNGLLQVLVRVKEGAKTVGIKAKVKDTKQEITAEFSIDVSQVQQFARLAGGDRKMSIESFKIWPTGKGFDDVEATYNFDDMNSSEFILFENYEADKKLDYLVFTARAVFPETERKMSMEFAGVSGEWEMKIYHDEETWPNPDPVEFITIKKHEIFDEKTDFVVPLEGFASYERMKIVLVCKNDGNYNLNDISFIL